MIYTQVVTVPCPGAVFSTVCVPHETREGIMEGYTVEVAFGGHVYALMDTATDQGEFTDAIDVMTGDVVRLRHAGPAVTPVV